MSNNNYPNWSGKTIIIAEDDQDNYLYLKAVLYNTNVKILHAKNGVEAVDMCRITPNIDMVLMDIIMPKMDGIIAAKLISKFRSDTSIIALSALLPEQNFKQKKVSSEFVAYILKPFTPAEIIKTIQKQFLVFPEKNYSTLQ